MRRRRVKKLLSLLMSLVLMLSTGAWPQLVEAETKDKASGGVEENIFKVTMDDKGYITPSGDSLEMLEKKAFSWDNVTSYFVLTDRFLNSDTSNDHSYGRGLKEDGNTPIDGLDYKTNPGTFHGGDLNGLTQKVKEGYFNDLGVNAIWITAPYEQIHGYTSANVKSNNANQYPDPDGQGFPYYSYHGYWTLDYTNIDENMGTAQDFGNFVDSCHERGIRVIMDIVLNHVGYTTMKDAMDYGFTDALKSDWKSYYFGNSTHLMGGDPESNNYWNKEANVWATKWWGPGFVRADYPGYTSAGGDDYHMSLSGLPDVVTEASASEVSTPPLLVTKWTQEGRIDKEQKELDDFFSKTGYKKQPRYYIIKWLTDYVREYGVDGFRCDTAKHVDKDAWMDLKKEGVKALKEWRANNPDKPGAQWTDDFWMTGEAWGHGMGKSEYFSQGGFDSMINFGFNKSGNPSGMEETYSSYASAINSDPEFNVLSYLKSHDDSGNMGVWKCSSQQMINQGTCLLLAPGGVQIYYGDEVNRGLGWEDFFTGSDYLDQRFRTDMDWNNYDKTCLEHWQKVGQFRNNHISVGAGQHQKLDGDVYTFSRTYHLEEDDEDKVVVAVPGKAGTYSISVGDVFEDGETITDAYSGKKCEVSGGKVSVTCDGNGVILLEGSGIVKPSVSAKTKGNADSYSSDTLAITLRGNKVKNTFYSINGGKKVSYNSDDVINIGGDTAYEEKTRLVLTGISEEDGSVITKEYTYQRGKEPTVSDGVFCVKVKKSEFSTAPNIFVYTNDANETSLAGAWPGAVMTDDQDDSECFSYTNEDIKGDAVIILSLGATSNTGGTWRSTPDKAKGLVAQGCMLYDKTSNALSEIPSGEPGKVTVNYKDTSGKVLKSIYRVGVIGREYKTYPADIEGYTLQTEPANATGTYEKNVEVNYIYTSGGENPTTSREEPTTSREEPTTSREEPTTSREEPTTSREEPTTSREEPTTSREEPTTSREEPTTSREEPTTSREEPTTSREEPTTSREEPTTSREEPTTSREEPTTSRENPTQPTENPVSSLKVTGFSVSIANGVASVGDRVSLVAKTKGGEGKIQYRFLQSKGTSSIIKNYSSSNVAKWSPKASGKYELKVYAKDSTGRIATKSIKNYTVNNKLKVKSFKVSPGSKKAKKGSKVKLTVSATGGSKKYAYKFAYKYQGSSKIAAISKYSSKKSVTWKPKKSGKYKLYAYVKDKARNKVVKKEIKTYIVK